MHLFAKLDGILPRNLLDWVHRAIALADYSLLEVTRVGPHHLLVLPLGDLRHTKVVIFADRHLMLLFIVIRTFFLDRRAHRECPLGDQHQLHPNAVGDRFGGLGICLTTQLDHPKNE